MKKLIKIRLSKQNVLDPREMKDIKGERGSWCNVGGEWVFTSCSNNSDCEYWYGSGATCE